MGSGIVSGNIDGISGNNIIGWAYLSDGNDISLNVRIYCDEELIGEALASDYRADLEQAGIGRGAHGFSISLNAAKLSTIKSKGAPLRLVLQSETMKVLSQFSLHSEHWQEALSHIYKINVETVKYSEVTGWCTDLSRPGSPVWLGLFIDEEMASTALADISRMDLKEAGLGEGNHGFSLKIPLKFKALLKNRSARVTLRDLSYPDLIVTVCDFTFPLYISQTDARLPKLQELTLHHIMRLRMLVESISDVARPLQSQHHALYERMLEPLEIPGELKTPNPPSSLPGGLSGFVDFSRHRMRQDANFDTSGDAANIDHFLKWYLSVYCTTRARLRAPLSAPEIYYLNQPIVIGGQRFALTRAVWYFLLEERSLQQAIELNDKHWYEKAIYWWSIHKSPSLFVEDCLVPENYAVQLRSTSLHWFQKDFPLSTFMELFFNENPALHFLNADNEQDRLLYTFVITLMALERPDYLRFVPSSSLQMLFSVDSGGPSSFNALLRHLSPSNYEFDVSWETYVEILEECGYNAASNSFRTITRQGNRVGAAARSLNAQETVDVQLIGPFAKASGLGQATRLSASALEKTELSCNFADFGLDNPAPEGFSNGGTVSSYKQAKINLIHLNAESIPLVLAYSPDVFTGSYNIGYFFWELDSPAACHYLALAVLDEVWVSTEYGVSIYKDHSDIPVTNVGMCFEDVADLDKLKARKYLERRFGLNSEHFVFLVAFDSFSFVQRKNPLGVLRAFQIAFGGVNDVRLIVKTQNRDSVGDPAQVRIWSQIDAIISSDPRIIVMNETLSYDNLVKLKLGSNCYISLHKSEGWGFGMIEAMNLKVPVVCTAYSGNLEFCSDQTAWMVDYEEVQLNSDEYIFVRRGQKWAEPDINSAALQFRSVYDKPDERNRKVQAAWDNVRKKFSVDAIGQRYGNRLKEILGGLQ